MRSGFTLISHHNTYLNDVLLFLSVLGLLYILKNIMILILYYFFTNKTKIHDFFVSLIKINYYSFQILIIII